MDQGKVDQCTVGAFIFFIIGDSEGVEPKETGSHQSLGRETKYVPHKLTLISSYLEDPQVGHV
jgi:hypothetical protein